MGMNPQNQKKKDAKKREVGTLSIRLSGNVLVKKTSVVSRRDVSMVEVAALMVVVGALEEGLKLLKNLTPLEFSLLGLLL